MHLIKCIGEHIVKLICGAEDSVKVRGEERARIRFPTSWVTEDIVCSKKQRKIILPPAPFRLTKSEIKTCNERIINIRTPHQMDWEQTMFSLKIHMKSVQWKHNL